MLVTELLMGVKEVKIIHNGTVFQVFLLPSLIKLCVKYFAI